MATKDEFRAELERVLTAADALGLLAVDVNAGNLHRRVGDYPGADHRMPSCCSVMRAGMTANDAVVSEPEQGAGASLTIRYRLPR